MNRRTRRNWSAQEDTTLQQEVEKALQEHRPLLWRELAKSVPGRSNKDCRKRWWNSLASDTVKGSWAESEDERLTEAVQKCGTNWTQVAQAVGSRTADQCSSHYSSVLDPEINHSDWTAAEDDGLLHSVLTHGTSWTRIAASHRPKRTPLTLKNRYAALRTKNGKGDSINRGNSRHSLSSTPSDMFSNKSLSSKAQRTNQRLHRWPTTQIQEVLDGEEDDDDDDSGLTDDQEDVDEDDQAEEPDQTTSRRDLQQDLRKQPENRAAHQGLYHQDRVVQPTQLLNNVSNGNLFAANQPAASGLGPQGQQAWTTPKNATHQEQYKSPYAQQDSIMSMPQDPAYTGNFGDDAGLGENFGMSPFGMPCLPFASTPSNQFTGDDMMELALPASTGFAASHKHTGPPSALASEQMMTPPSHSQSSSENSGGCDQNRRSALASYQVSINMTCTGTQLETVMVGLTNAGTNVTMKFDPKV